MPLSIFRSVVTEARFWVRMTRGHASAALGQWDRRLNLLAFAIGVLSY